MFLSINMTISEFEELTREYYEILALQISDLVDVKEYLITYMDPEKTINEKFFKEINENMYMKDSNKMINDYLDSIKNYHDHTIISVPVHNLNFIKNFINDKNWYFMTFVNKMISYVNMEYTWNKNLNYEPITIKQICDDFGKDAFWRTV